MRVRILYTESDGKFQEGIWDKPEHNDDEIVVESYMTGICRSDIDMALGCFQKLPIHMMGHEGLGIVHAVGKNITEVKVGDFVATRGEPAYADFYNCKQDCFIKVPELSPKYILEPVACGANLILSSLTRLSKRSGEYQKLLIIGSGFLSWVAYNTLKKIKLDFDISVVGTHNLDIWPSNVIKSQIEGSYNVIIDLKDSVSPYFHNIFEVDSLIIMGTDKKAKPFHFEKLIWNNSSMIFPSPRSTTFYSSMILAEEMITKNELNIDSFWTKSYNRDKEWKQAFEESIDRCDNFNRAYLIWK